MSYMCHVLLKYVDLSSAILLNVLSKLHLCFFNTETHVDCSSFAVFNTGTEKNLLLLFLRWVHF